MATISAGAGVIPLPAVGGLVDAALIRTTVTAYCRQLGLNNTEESAMMDKKKTEIINNYQSESIVSHFVSVAHSIGLSIGVEEISKLIPFVGSAIAGSIGFAKTLRYLIKSIDELEEVAMAVWENAAKQTIEECSN